MPKNWSRTAAVVIDVEYRCFRGCGGYSPRDEDNARASLKAAIDGMRDARVVPGDTKRWVKWGAFNLVTRRTHRGAGVTVIVRVA